MKSVAKARVLVFALLLSVHSAAAGGEFTKNLSPEKLRAAGLVKLTPEEIAQLETLIENYKTGAVEQAVAAVPPAPPAPAVKPAPEAKSGGILPDWVGALITLKRAEEAPAKRQVLETRIAGEFEGWSGRTNFKLENGQVWTQVNNESYVYTPALKSPQVKIFPATFGTFWLEVEGVNQRCRIRPIRLE
jgi:lipoprotein-anchoring transpeptidase ErfK/SrfK